MRWSWLQRWLCRTPSGQAIARERLRLVLAHDRADISPGMLELMKDDIIAVLRKYVDIDPAAVEVSILQEGRATRLVADIPLGKARPAPEGTKD